MSRSSEPAARLERLREELRLKKLDSLVLTSLPNVRYFCGFTGSNAMLVISERESTLLTDPRYTLQAVEEAGGDIVIAKGQLEAEAVKRLGRRKRIGFEDMRIRYSQFEALRSGVSKAAKWTGLGEVCERLRMVKSEAELALIRESVSINSKAYEGAMTDFVPGMTERELAADIEFRMKKLGAEGPSFDSIVAYRANSAKPHAQPGEAAIEGRGLLLIDMGSLRGGYASDMTRMAHLGSPSAKAKALYSAVKEAQAAAIDRVRPGVPASTVDAAARKVLGTHGFGKAFVHSTGHGLGLEIHELPRIGKKDGTRLEQGMTITIEPGAYLEGFGGVRIEDTVEVTRTGANSLTPTPRTLVVL